MKVLVTGATGLVGRKLCQQLLEQGHDLAVIGRGSLSRFRQNFSLPCEYYTWSELDQLPDVAAVCHLAGEPIASGYWTKNKKKKILDSRVETTRMLLDHFQMRGKFPGVFVSASAVGYYGDRGNEELSEDSSLGDGFLAEVCNEWEKASDPMAERTRVVNLRLGLVLDNSGGFLEPMEKIFSLGVAGPIGSGKQWISWVHIEDLVNMFIYAIKTPTIKGVYNAVSPQPVTNQEWTKLYAAQLKVKAPFPVPSVFLKLALGEMSQLALNSQKVSSKKIQETGFHFQFKILEEALRHLYQWKSKPGERLFLAHQWVPQNKTKVFPFFSDAKNLEKITPPWLHFKITQQSTPEIQKGTEIHYRLRLKGLPMRWKTQIVDWSPPHKFVDDQTSGPYKKWHHTHKFTKLGSGTLMTDRVVYEIPFGYFGRLLAGSLVNRDIRSIFSYRQKVINDLIKKWAAQN